MVDFLIDKGIQYIMLSKMDVDILNTALDILLKDNKISTSDINNICKKHDKYNILENGYIRIELILSGYNLIKEDASSGYPGVYIPTEKAKEFRNNNYFNEIREKQISENLPQQQLLDIRRNRKKSNIAIIVSIITALLSLVAIILSITKL